jgi:hypothetical protein
MHKNLIFSIADRINLGIEMETGYQPRFILDTKRANSKYLHYYNGKDEFVIRISNHDPKKDRKQHINIVKPEEDKIDYYIDTILEQLIPFMENLNE